MGMSLEDALYIQRKVSKAQKSRAIKGKKVYLGRETRPGWRGELPFYLFQCPNCEKLVKDYPHSFPERQYLLCPECGERINFVRILTGLKMFFSSLSSLFRLRFSK